MDEVKKSQHNLTNRNETMTVSHSKLMLSCFPSIKTLKTETNTHKTEKQLIVHT